MLEDVQLLHEELLLFLYIGQVGSVLGVVGISVLCYVLPRVVRGIIVCSKLCSGSRRSRDLAGYSLGCC